jgi:nicotinamidase-related amidase
MTVSTLDPTTALIVVDLQVGTTSAPTAHPIAGVVANAVDLIAAFRAAGLPVVLAAVDGMAPGRTAYGPGGREFPAPFSDLVPELGSQADDLRILRRTWSVFAGTDLDTQLKALGVTQVVVVGVATSFGVESTSRQAYDLGYNVVIAIDAITDRGLESHDNTVARLLPALGELGTTAEVLALLPVR